MARKPVPQAIRRVFDAAVASIAAHLPRRWKVDVASRSTEGGVLRFTSPDDVTGEVTVRVRRDVSPRAAEALGAANSLPGAFIDAELAKMSESLCLPTASHSMVGVLNEYVRLAEHAHARRGGTPDLGWLPDWLARTPMGPLRNRSGFPDRELAALVTRST